MIVFLIIYVLGMVGAWLTIREDKELGRLSSEGSVELIAHAFILLFWPSMVVYAIFTIARKLP